MRCQIHKEPSQPICQGCDLTSFHFPFVLLLPKGNLFILIISLRLIANLRIWLLCDVLLIIIMRDRMVLVLHTFYTLSLCRVKKYLIWTFFLIYCQGFHRLSIYKSLWTLTFEAFVADVILVTFWHDVIFGLIWKVIIRSYLFRRRVEFLLFVKLNLINIF